MKFILKLFKEDALWQEVMRRQGFTIGDKVEASLIWSNVFHRTPELSDYLKRREIMLLKTVTLGDRSSQFVLGQIAENRLWQRFDVAQGALPKVEVLNAGKPVISKEDFIGKWNKPKDVVQEPSTT